ncbi:hypothetical protein Agub_g12353, partial [Astrephomene gubernaculifera]
RGRSGARKVLITGTDIPDLTAALLRRAAEALDQHEVVLGPALDGGYYLLGLTRLEEEALFRGIPWSSSRVLGDTVAAAAACGLRVAPLEWLPRLRDVDTREDLEEWVATRTGALGHQKKKLEEGRSLGVKQLQQQGQQQGDDGKSAGAGSPAVALGPRNGVTRRSQPLEDERREEHAGLCGEVAVTEGRAPGEVDATSDESFEVQLAKGSVAVDSINFTVPVDANGLDLRVIELQRRLFEVSFAILHSTSQSSSVEDVGNGH